MAYITVAVLFLCVTLRASAQQVDNSSTPQNSGNNTLSPALDVLAKLHANQYMGVAKCKSLKDCGLGLKCDALLGLCLPLDAPNIPLFEKSCQNDSECSALYSCIAGQCTFCGPKRCSKTTECCSGVPGRVFQCASLESSAKQLLAAQLGKPIKAGKAKKGSKEGKDESNSVESDELQALGFQKGQPFQAPFQQGKRCWAECISDADCQGAKLPAQMNAGLACCRGFCLARDACFGSAPQFPLQALNIQQFLLHPQNISSQNVSQAANSNNTTGDQQSNSSTTISASANSTSDSTTAASSTQAETTQKITESESTDTSTTLFLAEDESTGTTWSSLDVSTSGAAGLVNGSSTNTNGTGLWSSRLF